MKKKMVIIIPVAILVLIGLAFGIFKGVEYFSNESTSSTKASGNYKKDKKKKDKTEETVEEETVEEEELIPISIDDDLAKKAFDMIDIWHASDMGISDKFFSGNTVSVNDLSNEEKMFLTLYYYDKQYYIETCNPGPTTKIAYTDLEHSFFEDSSYLEEYKKNPKNVWEYELKYEEPNFSAFGMSCDGGVFSDVMLKKLVAASKGEKTLTIDVKFAYLEFSETGNYDAYDNVEAEGNPLEIDISDADFNKDYKSVRFTFKIDGSNLYFVQASAINQ